MQPDPKDMARLWDMLDAARTAVESREKQKEETAEPTGAPYPVRPPQTAASLVR